MAEADLVENLKPRNWLTFAVTVAVLLWAAPVSAGLVHTLANRGPAATGRNTSTITLNKTTGQHGTRSHSHSRGGTGTGTAPPPNCDTNTPPPPPVPPTPVTQRGRHARGTSKSSTTLAPVTAPTVAPATIPVTSATQKGRQPRGTRPSRSGPPPVPTPVSDPGTCPPLVIDVPPGNPPGPPTPPTPSSVPEPASLLIFGSGIAAVVAYRRRKKRAA